MDVTPDTVKEWLVALGEDRHWLADHVGVSKRTLDNWFSDGFPPYAVKSISRLRNELDATVPALDESAIQLTISQWKELSRRATECGFDDEMEFVNSIIRAALAKPSSESRIGERLRVFEPPISAVAEDPTPYKAFTLPFLGAVAAGQPSESPRNETIPVAKEYPSGHFVVEVNGGSMEPDYPDGSRWVIDGRDKFTPKDGQDCVVSDGSGSYLKRWNRERGVFESINPDFTDVIPAEGAKLQGYPVEML